MERLQNPTLSYTIRLYLALTKPGIIMGNVVTAIAGFALASKAVFNFPLFLATLEGLVLIIASACVFNNVIDREADRLMMRTKKRPLARGLIAPKQALIFGSILGAFGGLTLALFTSWITLLTALLGLAVYVGIYSFAKYKTVYGTLIGSVAGAVPPVVGYTAVTGSFDYVAFLFFIMMVFWQMPHFYAIAIYRLKDYKAASIPVFPAIKKMWMTKVQMAFFVIAFTYVAALFSIQGFKGLSFLIGALLLGSLWVFLSLRGFFATNVVRWARQMFIFSLVVVMSLSFLLSFW